MSAGNDGAAPRDEFIRSYVDDPSKRTKESGRIAAEYFLARIEDLQPALNAFVTITADLALRDADVGALQSRGRPLDGMTIAVKDNIDVRGVPTTVGSKLYLDNVASADAEVVRRLREAGALIVGKAAMHEFALGQTCASEVSGTCRNPWGLNRIPGGSSGGSGVAVAADLCVAALGTDTGGSVRVPSSLTGVSGLRPSFGRISNRGVFPLAPSFDTVGPMARHMADVAAIFDVLQGHDPNDPRSQTLPRLGRRHLPKNRRNVVIAVPQGRFFDEVDADVARSVMTAIEVLTELGMEMRMVEIPGAAEAANMYATLLRIEAAAVHHGLDEAALAAIDPEVRSRLSYGASLAAWEAAILYDKMAIWHERMLRIFEAGVSLLLTPTTPSAAPELDGPGSPTFSALGRFTQSFSLARLPAVSIPGQPTRQGLPTGIQFVGPPYAERLLIAVAEEFQRVTSWHRLRPSVIGISLESRAAIDASIGSS